MPALLLHSNEARHSRQRIVHGLSEPVRVYPLTGHTANHQLILVVTGRQSRSGDVPTIGEELPEIRAALPYQNPHRAPRAKTWDVCKRGYLSGADQPTVRLPSARTTVARHAIGDARPSEPGRIAFTHSKDQALETRSCARAETAPY